jgi:hypothetical protein
MFGIVRAYGCAFKSFFQPGVLVHLLWPMVLSMLAWVGIGIAFWGRLTQLLLEIVRHWQSIADRLPPGGGTEQVLATALTLSLYLISIPFVFLTATLLVELVSLPILIEKVAKLDYPHLERREGGSLWKSLQNTLVSFFIAALITVLTLPLWIVPGINIVISLLLTAWVNYRSFHYDVLVNHADASEIQALPKAHRGRLLVLAIAVGILNLVPVVNFFSVPFVGLAFAHYLLHALDLSRHPIAAVEILKPA